MLNRKELKIGKCGRINLQRIQPFMMQRKLKIKKTTTNTATTNTTATTTNQSKNKRTPITQGLPQQNEKLHKDTLETAVSVLNLC